MSISLAAKAQTAGNGSTGFDYLRIGLSLSVLFWHCYSVLNFDDSVRIFWAGPWRALPAAILPMFFALSGFLVAGSLARTPIPQFALLRLLRIVPALAFETILAAVVLGAVFTVLPLSAYFTAPEFYAYFLNVVGYIHYTLPGVFDGRMINAQLWTVPTELECYLVLIVVALAGVTRRRRFFAAGLFLAALAMTLFAVGAGVQGPYAQLGGRVLVYAFLAGVLVHLYRERIPHDGRLFAGSVLLAGLLLSFRETSYLAAFPVAYATVWLGLLNPRTIPFGDLSYGVFLFHFPILQAAYHSLGAQATYLELTGIVLPLSILCAAVSWSWIERPILTRKRAIIARAETLFGGIGRLLRPMSPRPALAAPPVGRTERIRGV